MSFRAGRLRCEHSCRRLQPNGRKPGAGGWCATVRPAVIARSCCSWENRPRSPSCCFTFRIKSQGLARPATEQGSKAASVSLSAPRGSISPELSVLARPPGGKNRTDYPILELPRKREDALSMPSAVPGGHLQLHTPGAPAHSCLQARPSPEVSPLLDSFLIFTPIFLLPK